MMPLRSSGDRHANNETDQVTEGVNAPGLGEDIRPVGAEAVISSAVAALFRAAY